MDKGPGKDRDGTGNRALALSVHGHRQEEGITWFREVTESGRSETREPWSIPRLDPWRGGTPVKGFRYRNVAIRF